jgi:hypothetical protein
MAANFNENDQLQTGTILAQNEKGGENICVRAADVLPVNTEDSESVKDVVTRMNDCAREGAESWSKNRNASCA